MKTKLIAILIMSALLLGALYVFAAPAEETQAGETKVKAEETSSCCKKTAEMSEKKCTEDCKKACCNKEEKKACCKECKDTDKNCDKQDTKKACCDAKKTEDKKKPE